MAMWAAGRSTGRLCAWSRSIIRTISSYGEITGSSRYAAAQNAAAAEALDDSQVEESAPPKPKRTTRSKKVKSSVAEEVAVKSSVQEDLNPSVEHPVKSSVEGDDNAQLAAEKQQVGDSKQGRNKERRMTPNRMRYELHNLLADAHKEGRSLDEVLDKYDGTFSMGGFQRSFIAVNPDFAIPLFNWAKSKDSFSYKPRLVYNLVSSLRKADRLEEVHKFILENLDDKPEFAQLGYSGLYIGYIQQEDMEKADAIRTEMKERGLELHPSAFTKLLEMRYKKDGLEGLLELHQENIAKGWITDAVGCNDLITKLCKAKRTTEAYEIFMDTTERGVIHIENTHQALINHLCMNNKVEEACHVVEDLFKVGLKSKSTPIKLLVNKLCDRKDYDRALKMFKEMIKEIPPNGVNLVRELCEEGELDKAMEAVKAMKEYKYQLDSKALIVKLCVENRLEDARLVFDAMVDAGVSPDAETCTALAMCGK